MSRFPFRMAGAVAALIGLAGLVAGCGDDDDADDAGNQPSDTTTSTPAADLDGSITVLAAASLTDAFDEIAIAFEETHQGVVVEIEYGGSSALRDQIVAGAPADVFASADPSPMDAVAEGGGVVGDPATFATNELEIAVPAGNEAEVEGLDDFGDESLLIGLCDEQVPCGVLGREVLDNAGVSPAPDTNEPDVRSLLEKIETGELDAGLVYVTDVEWAGDDVEGIEIPDEDNVVAHYPIAPLAASENPAVAAAFVDFVLSEEGQAVLDEYGFGPPG
jgi:molybdate transport system substrate-binding protein